jgi:hypothetical protein
MESYNADTAPEAMERWLERLRRMTAGQKNRDGFSG